MSIYKASSTIRNLQQKFSKMNPPPYKLFKKIEVFFRGLPQSNCALHSYGAIAISAKHDIVRNDLDHHKCIPDICPFWYATILFGLEKVRQKSA